MSEEVPNNHGFLKFIVIFMGILIMLGLGVVVWKMIDLAKQKAARAEMAASRQEKLDLPQMRDTSLMADVMLHSGERIMEMSALPNGLWLRIGQKGKSHRIIFINRDGKTTGTIYINRDVMATEPKNTP